MKKKLLFILFILTGCSNFHDYELFSQEELKPKIGSLKHFAKINDIDASIEILKSNESSKEKRNYYIGIKINEDNKEDRDEQCIIMENYLTSLGENDFELTCD